MEAHFLFVIVLLMQLNASNDMDFFFCQQTVWKNVHSSMQIFYIFFKKEHPSTSLVAVIAVAHL